MLFAEVSLQSADAIVWTGLAGLILLATVAGFFAGVMCAPALQERALQRAARHVQKLYELTTVELGRASRLCRMLGEAASSPLQSEQWQKLEASREQLSEAWKSLSERQATRPESEAAACAMGSTVFQINWQRSPVEPVTQLPDRAAFEANLKVMLTSSAEHCHPSGVLLVRVDKCDQLASRYGQQAVTTLQNKLASVVIKSTRDEDLVCRLAPEMFAVLMPAVSPLGGARLAETIRCAVREHAFRAEEGGPAILVTASFGYATCLPNDPPTLILDRAGEALDKSQSSGRNQLHVHDANSRAVMRVG